MFREDDDIRTIVAGHDRRKAARRFGTGDLEQSGLVEFDEPGVHRTGTGSVSSNQRLYITDGHHRAMASVEAPGPGCMPEGAGVPAVLFPEHALTSFVVVPSRIVAPLLMD